MLPINVYPYLNLNDLNLDFILKTIGELRYEVTNFVSLNAIKYADPIQWDITRQYEKNTIVIDPVTGTAYISVAPVPAGVALTRTEFWTVVFDLGSFVTRAAQNFTSNWESETTTTATFATNTGEWLVWGDVLYKALTNITAGDAYVVGGNIDHFTMEDLYNAYLNTIANILAIVGDLVDLNTSDKTSIVNAINEVNAGLAQEINARKEKLYINADDFGVDNTGATDSTSAINGAISAANDSDVIFTRGLYLIDNEPNANSGEYDFSLSRFTGAGAGDPSAYAGKFSSPLNNPGLYAVGKYQKANINEFPCPIGNGVVLESHEIDNNSAADYIDVIGSIANGSSVLVVDDATGIERGDGVLLVSPTDPAWLDGSTRANTVRVVSVTGNSVTIGADNSNGAGNAVATPWTGSTITNGSFKIRKRRWQVVDYKGITSPAISNPDRLSWVRNDILEIAGCSGNCYEIEVNSMGAGTEISRGLFITGRGNGVAQMAAIDIQRAEYEYTNNWLYGLAINSAANGIMVSASKGLIINTHWRDSATNTTQELYVGIEYDNIDDAVRAVRPLFAGRTIVNGATGIILERSDDAAPAGYYLQFMNSDATQNIFTVNTAGVATGYGLTINADGNDTGIIYGNVDATALLVKPNIVGRLRENGSSGILLERNTDASPTGYYLQFMNSDATQNIFTVDVNGICMAGIYKMLQFVQADTAMTQRGYVTMQDANGDPIKVMVAN